jgi:D-alanine-D-alanine ligase
MSTVVVLGGGNSPEREVSLRSAKSVATALETAGFRVAQLDPANADLSGIPRDDVIVFPILHGAGGEDGIIQQELESLGLPYLGSDSQASAICFDKGKTRLAMKEAGLPIARGDVVTADTYPNNPLALEPHVLKVTTGGSSIGTYIVKDPDAIDQAKVDEIFQLGSEAVIEQLVMGVEITVPVLGKRALPVIEIRPPADAEFDYENKYNGATAELCPPESIDQATQQRAQTLAEQTQQALGCRHLSRTDMIVRPNGEFILLEINTMPGMTDQSLYPKAAAVAGLSMPQLMKLFVSMVEETE